MTINKYKNVFSLLGPLWFTTCGVRAVDVAGQAEPSDPHNAAVPAIPAVQHPADPSALQPPDACVPAIRTDDCCKNPVSVLMSELAADPCLKRLPLREDGAWCIDKWPENCALIDCVPNVDPESWINELNDASYCDPEDECQTDADCAIGRAWGACCTWPQPFPKKLIDSDPCVTAWPETDDQLYPPAGCPAADCSLVKCGTGADYFFPGGPSGARCRNEGIRRCVWE